MRLVDDPDILRGLEVDKRTVARELAMQALYQLDVQGPGLLEDLGGFFAAGSSDDFVRELAQGWTVGTWENLAQCDELIASSTAKWRIDRLSCVDRSILRLAVYQLRFRSDIPPKVVINEAIELAKKFGTDKSSAFVNGVLDAVLTKILSGNLQ